MNKVCQCARCHKWVTKKVADYSMKKYGEVYCYNCQTLIGWYNTKSSSEAMQEIEEKGYYEDEFVRIH